MQADVADARQLVDAVMRTLGHEPADAALIADHLIDCELRGVHYGGLARALSIAERMRRTVAAVAADPRRAGDAGLGPYRWRRSHRIRRRASRDDDGHRQGRGQGHGVVGAHNTWYTGMLSFYAEMVTAHGLVDIIASNASPWVAPHGASEGRARHEPDLRRFPSDRGSGHLGHRHVLDHARGSHAGAAARASRCRRAWPSTPPGSPTQDAAAALDGAFAAWGGHKGSGLAIVVQMLGALAGGAFIPPDLAQFGFLILAIRPDLLTPPDEFTVGGGGVRQGHPEARPVEGGAPVRMPFDRSREERRRRRAEDVVDVPDLVYSALVSPCARRPARSAVGLPQ